MATPTLTSPASELELEVALEPLLYDDMLEVDLPAFSFDLGDRAYEGALNWPWGGSPEWALN